MRHSKAEKAKTHRRILHVVSNLPGDDSASSLATTQVTSQERNCLWMVAEAVGSALELWKVP